VFDKRWVTYQHSLSIAGASSPHHHGEQSSSLCVCAHVCVSAHVCVCVCVCVRAYACPAPWCTFTCTYSLRVFASVFCFLPPWSLFFLLHLPLASFPSVSDLSYLAVLVASLRALDFQYSIHILRQTSFEIFLLSFYGLN
jgi:hypothetical protein